MAKVFGQMGGDLSQPRRG